MARHGDRRPRRNRDAQRSDRPPRQGRGPRPDRPQRPPHGAPRGPQGRQQPWSREREKAALWRPGPDARVVRAEAGMKLAAFFTHEHPHLSGRAARRLLEEGCCRINGRIETFGSRELVVGDVVEFFLPRHDREHKFDERRILHDANGVFAYDKPAWLPVTPTEGPKSWSLLDILKAAVEGPIIPVHRLDADTSGIVLFAREERVARALEAAFRDHKVEKTYHAIVRGHPRETGERRSYLVKVASGRGFERWQSGRGPEAREAITTWAVEEHLGRFGSRVRVEPKTGRYHQIRIHFSEMGHPIYGDRIYGDRQDPIHADRHLLHASRVQLADPTTNEPLDIRSRMPREFAEAEAQLRKL
jgi:23S rRNA pseudouridine955/2504/2580 synthase/23S rRNA pseudouridine1911/1915/1917 synthase